MATNKAVNIDKNVKVAVKTELFDALRTALTKPQGKSKKSFTQEYIDLMLKSAKSNPNGAIGQLIARQLLSEDLINQLDAETDKYLSRDIDFNEYRLLKSLYHEQQEVFNDRYSSKILCIGSRRIGKTELAARLLLKDTLREGRHALFISTKFENGIRQCYPLVVDLAKSLGLPVVKESKNEGEVAFLNGSNILFKGNSDKSQADKLLGYKFSCVVIDEAQNQCNLKYLLDTVLGPAMTDYPDAQLILIGTPPRIPKTEVENIWFNQKGWRKYGWAMKQNPFLKNTEKYIKTLCENKGLTEDAPFIQREYFGVWAYDTEAQVFKDYKVYTNIPDDFIPTDVAIGCDYGFQDYNAIIALAYNRNSRQAYVIDERKFNKSTVSEIVEQCRDVYEGVKKFCITRDKDFELNHIAFYCDTNEQSISHEMSTNYKLPVYNCYKHDKKMAISQLADWCRTGKVLNKENGILVDEFERTVYKRDDQDNILTEIDDDIFHPDAMDALLYASRQYAYDCGIDNRSQKVEKKQDSRAATLPKWMQEEEEEIYSYDDE